MKIVGAILSLFLSPLPLIAGSSCLSPIDGWQVFNYQNSSPTPTTLLGGWKVRRLDVPADPKDDGDWDKFLIGISNGKDELKQGCCYPGTPFLLGHFGGSPGKLAMMSVTNVRNGLGIAEWELGVLEIRPEGITITATAEFYGGGKDSIFRGYDHELGYLKTDLKSNQTGGDWYSGKIFWFQDGKFIEDKASFSIKSRRLYEKFFQEMNSDTVLGVIGKPFKWLRIEDYWCKDSSE